MNLRLGQEAVGHVVARLLGELPIDVSAELMDKAKVLDGYYIPARYPNAHPEGPPFEHFGARQSEEAIALADEILGFVRAQMAREG
jgi:HEPN domain-containing protein